MSDSKTSILEERESWGERKEAGGERGRERKREGEMERASSHR